MFGGCSGRQSPESSGEPAPRSENAEELEGAQAHLAAAWLAETETSQRAPLGVQKD